ncbi:PaaI family thioesterase [Methylocapsa sp. S129]|uniref:PaaI family thioesterase n=1 Tax=Methylocapsa sp. S129 TaxID=1641869 RepID=UPI00131C1661|nr:PaaI family thioesterase [Methylocapsa sp. S129]
MHSPATPPVLDAEAVSAYLAAEFPQIGIGRNFSVEAVGPMSARLRLHFRADQLRPGGTISGPTIFALADVALYVAILAQVGHVKLAVTTNLNINFLRKPGPSDLIGDARLLKLGKRLAVGEVTMFSVGAPEIVAHATGTYSIPPRNEDEVL